MNAVNLLKREFIKSSKDAVTFLKAGDRQGELKSIPNVQWVKISSVNGVWAFRNASESKNYGSAGESQSYFAEFYILKEFLPATVDHNCRIAKGALPDTSNLIVEDMWLIKSMQLKKLLNFNYEVVAFQLDSLKKGNSVWV